VTTIHLVRHAQASLGAADYDQLSERGLRQATLLGQWWKQIGVCPDAVVAGSLRRHGQSARACLAALGSARELATDSAFNEYDGEDILRVHRPDLGDGAAVGRFLAQAPHPARDFQAAFGAAVQRWVSGAHDADYAEPWPAFRSRVLAALRALDQAARRDGHASVAVFTSGGPIAVACQGALGVPDAQALDLNWALLNAGVTQLRATAGGLRLRHFNAVSHLEVARESTLLTHR
jgi:broad specificity phosphatase PhoE